MNKLIENLIFQDSELGILSNFKNCFRLLIT